MSFMFNVQNIPCRHSMDERGWYWQQHHGLVERIHSLASVTSWLAQSA